MTNNTTSGVLLVDKPAGVTSHDAVAIVRRLLQQRRVGHAGTLDPFATGLLLVGVGYATRLLDYTHQLPKTYEATLQLGAVSTTDDLTGEITPQSEEPPTNTVIAKVLSRFVGPQQQVPPRYAAIKVQGKKLYEYARAGEEVTRMPRSVAIFAIDILAYTYPHLAIRVSCSSGTYIRALARDIGEALGVGAYLTQLRRTQIGNWLVDDAVKLNALTAETASGALMSPSTLVAHLPSITVSDENVAQWKQGRAVGIDPLATAQQSVAVYTAAHDLIGIGSFSTTLRLLEPKIVFPS
ncbi:MAG: tRNA pseudouridine(55) synthase TruB [Candidatus Andersenbacteria bacterium]